MGDTERQKDELASLAEIYTPEEFCYPAGKDLCGRMECILKGTLTLPAKLLKIKYLNLNLQHRCPTLPYLRFFVRHLPPATLYINFPSNYPSVNPPEYRMSVTWLPTWEISKICQKLDELWLNHEGNEILFIWMGFLKHELLGLLDIQQCLDISFLFTAFEEPNDYLKSDLSQLSDPRASNDNMFLNPKEYLVRYDSTYHQIDFQNSFHACKICLEEFSGRQCLEFHNCEHVCCKDCAKTYIITKINEGQISSIPCPEHMCNTEITPKLIRELIPFDLYQRYECLLLQITLDSMSDITYCPRLECQYPVTKDEDKTLASCANCFYNFCIYCRKVYHGVAPCVMSSHDQKKLIEEYQVANREQRKLLEKKHGPKQLQIVVEKYLTNSYLKENTRQCPNCKAYTTKIEGCNKMICAYCQAHFCWLCGKHLVGENPYKHFNDSVNTCYKRLFEGVDLSNEGFEDAPVEEELWEAFPLQM